MVGDLPRRAAIVALNLRDWDSAEVSDALYTDYGIATQRLTSGLAGYSNANFHTANALVEFSFTWDNTKVFGVRLRRMLGLFAFFYACLHCLTYVWFDQFFDAAAMLKDVVKRPFITVGFAAFVLLIPLAVTSTVCCRISRPLLVMSAASGLA